MGLNVLIVRHGEMPINRMENWTTPVKKHLDDPLTTRGVAEAEALGSYYTAVEFDKIYASNKIRTQQTAENIRKHLRNSQTTIVVDKRIREREIGEMEDMSMLQIIEESKKLGVNPCYFPIGGSETVPEVQQRAQEFLDDLFSAYPNEPGKSPRVILVSHGAFIGCLMKHFAERSDLYSIEGEWNDEMARTIIPPNISVTQFEVVTDDGSPTTRRRLVFSKFYNLDHLDGVELPD